MPSHLLRHLLLIVILPSLCFAQAPRSRRADSLTHFFVGSWGPFDEWPKPDPKDERFGKVGDLRPFRYYNLSDSLNFNAEVRGFWDYPTHRPAPAKIVLGGEREPDLDVLIIEPQQLFQAFDQAFYLRFEFERHAEQTAET